METEDAASASSHDDFARRSLIGLLGAVAGASLLSGCADAAEADERANIGQGTNALFTIGGGVAKTPYASLEGAVSQNQTGTPITVIIDKAIEVAASVTVPSHMTLRFQDGGQLVVRPGTTVTLSGPIQASA